MIHCMNFGLTPEIIMLIKQNLLNLYHQIMNTFKNC